MIWLTLFWEFFQIGLFSLTLFPLRKEYAIIYYVCSSIRLMIKEIEIYVRICRIYRPSAGQSGDY